MSHDIEYTDQFEDWWNGLNEEEQEDVGASVCRLEEYGVTL